MLSVFRLVLAGAIPFCGAGEWIWMIPAGCASDLLDGWLARRWKVDSWGGGVLDATADKLFVLSVLVTFVLSGKFSPWWIPGIIVRDITVTAIALYALSCRAWASFRRMNASRFGKLATGGQFVLFLVVLLREDFILPGLVLAVLFSFLAACDYGMQFINVLRNRPVEKHSRRQQNSR